MPEALRVSDGIERRAKSLEETCRYASARSLTRPSKRAEAETSQRPPTVHVPDFETARPGGGPSARGGARCVEMCIATPRFPQAASDISEGSASDAESMGYEMLDVVQHLPAEKSARILRKMRHAGGA